MANPITSPLASRGVFAMPGLSGLSGVADGCWKENAAMFSLSFRISSVSSGASVLIPGVDSSKTSPGSSSSS